MLLMRKAATWHHVGGLSHFYAPSTSTNRDAAIAKADIARVEFDERDNIFVGRVLGVNSIIRFHGESVAGLRAAFVEAVDDYLADCRERGVVPDKPASGKLMLRIDPGIHAAISIAVSAAGESVNQWSEEVLGRAARDACQTGPTACSRHRGHRACRDLNQQ